MNGSSAARSTAPFTEHHARAAPELAAADRDRFFALSLDMLCISSGDGFFKWLNPSFAQTLGWTIEELLSRPYTDFVHPDDVAGTIREVERQINAGQKVFEFENRYRHKDGSWRVLSWKSVAEGDLMYAVARDVTERGRLESALYEANAELEKRVAARTEALQSEVAERGRTEQQLRQAQKMEAIGNLTGGMAHDFNNLLGVIIGNLDLLNRRQNSDPRLQELTRDALEAALRGADLTKRLLAFARRQPLQPQRLDVNELVDRMIKLVRRTLGENIDVAFEAGEKVWPVVADPAQLEASLVNLINNARDAMPKGGTLTIATSNRFLDEDYASLNAGVTPGDYAVIEVSDTGTGMPPEIVSQIFEPFFTTKERDKGTGLGLSMVFGFMKQSGGHINVYSELGLGTTFRLFLPRAVPGADAVEAPNVRADVRGGTETILAVEDNASMRRVVVRQLTELGYRLLEAENGTAALTILETENVDLLFSDVVMPGGISGYDLARAALSRRPNLKVVMTSGFPDGNLDAKGGPPVNLRLLSKPYRKDDLARTLREELDA